MKALCMMYVESYQKACDMEFQEVSVFTVFITAIHIFCCLLLTAGSILKMKDDHCTLKEGKEVEIAL